MRDDGGPAYPHDGKYVLKADDLDQLIEIRPPADGMSLCDVVALAVLPQIFRDSPIPSEPEWNDWAKTLVRTALCIGEAYVAEKRKRENSNGQT